MFGLDLGLSILLIFCILIACAFEFVNGFHDTANAVATVIYTNSLKPQTAVIWSGICNFIGVFVGGIGVAMGIINLLPSETLTDQNIYHGIGMILALLFTAIFWNLGTWYLGLPSSSSHTLIGSILGVGLAYSLIPGNSGVSVNWSKASDIGLSLLISPVVGFGMAFALMALLKVTVKDKSVFKEPPKNKKPPMWIRSILILTCTGVSFAHGSNDGQKGVGLVMLILIGIVPSYFALDLSKNLNEIPLVTTQVKSYVLKIDESTLDEKEKKKLTSIKDNITELESRFALGTISPTEYFGIRKSIVTITKELGKLSESKNISLSVADLERMKKPIKELKTFTDYAPMWVLIIISLSLGLGTMVGWKRIVLTIGEKIGKSHLNYAQGASAELVASSTIGLSTFLGLPVSTTHVLSSGIAGSMASSGGVKNLQPETVRKIALAWILTLPVCITMSGGMFLLFRLIM